MAVETVEQAIKGIRNKYPNMDSLKNEGETKQFVVERILRALDWEQILEEEVKKEYPVDPVGKDKVDYALNPDSPTMVFVEAKASGVNFDNKPVQQLLKYCFQRTVNLAVLTDGRRWWLYLPQYQGPQGKGLHWSERRFSEIDITSGGPAKIQREFEKFLSKEKVSSGKAIEAAQIEIDKKINEKIAKNGIVDAWNKIVSTPSEDLVKVLTDATYSLCGVKPNKPLVKEFFHNHRLKVSDFDRSQPKAATNGGNGQQNGKRLFTFNGTEYSVKTWKQVLVKLCELIYDEQQDQFDRIMNVQGTTASYFSKNSADLKDPKQIGNSGIFAETAPLSQLGVKQRCRMVLEEFGYPEDFLKT